MKHTLSFHHCTEPPTPISFPFSLETPGKSVEISISSSTAETISFSGIRLKGTGFKHVEFYFDDQYHATCKVKDHNESRMALCTLKETKRVSCIAFKLVRGKLQEEPLCVQAVNMKHLSFEESSANDGMASLMRFMGQSSATPQAMGQLLGGGDVTRVLSQHFASHQAPSAGSTSTSVSTGTCSPKEETGATQATDNKISARSTSSDVDSHLMERIDQLLQKRLKEMEDRIVERITKSLES